MLSMPIQKLSRRRRRNGSDRRNARKSPACAGKQRKKNKKKMILPQSCKGITAVQAQGNALRLNCRFSLTTLGKYHFLLVLFALLPGASGTLPGVPSVAAVSPPPSAQLLDRH